MCPLNSQETLPQQEAGTPPRQISHMEWFRGVWFIAHPPGSTSPFPLSSNRPEALEVEISSGLPDSLLRCHPACLSFYGRDFSCPVFLLALALPLLGRFIGCANFNPVKRLTRAEFSRRLRGVAQKKTGTHGANGENPVCHVWANAGPYVRISGYKI